MFEIHYFYTFQYDSATDSSVALLSFCSLNVSFMRKRERLQRTYHLSAAHNQKVFENICINLHERKINIPGWSRVVKIVKFVPWFLNVCVNMLLSCHVYFSLLSTSTSLIFWYTYRFGRSWRATSVVFSTPYIKQLVRFLQSIYGQNLHKNVDGTWDLFDKANLESFASLANLLQASLHR